MQTSLEDVGAPLEASRASCRSPHPGPRYQKKARPFRCVRPGCGWSYLQEVLKERERERMPGSVSLMEVRGGLAQKPCPRILRLRGFHLVFGVCIFLAHCHQYNLFSLYFISKFSLSDEKSRGLGPRRSPAGALASQTVPPTPQLPTPQNGPLRMCPTGCPQLLCGTRGGGHQGQCNRS